MAMKPDVLKQMYVNKFEFVLFLDILHITHLVSERIWSAKAKSVNGKFKSFSFMLMLT